MEITITTVNTVNSVKISETSRHLRRELGLVIKAEEVDGWNHFVVHFLCLDGKTGACRIHTWKDGSSDYQEQGPYEGPHLEDFPPNTLVEYTWEGHGHGYSDSLKVADLVRLEKLYFGVS